MIAEGQMVRFKTNVAGWHMRNPLHIYTALKVEGPDPQERMVLILHPGGKTSWEFFHNLTPLF